MKIFHDFNLQSIYSIDQYLFIYYWHFYFKLIKFFICPGVKNFNMIWIKTAHLKMYISNDSNCLTWLHVEAFINPTKSLTWGIT